MMINTLKKAAPLLLALIINGAGHAYFVITIPVIGREMALSDVNVGLILTISALMLIITGPIWGWLCDKIGRKKVLVIGLLCSGIASVAIGMLIGQAELLTASFFSVYLLTIRLVQALLSSGLKPATQAVIVDLTEHSTRISGMGIMGATFGMGAVTGGLIAMLSGHKYIVTGYVAIGILMLISSLWVALQLPETRPQVSQKQQQWFLSPFIICFSTTLLGIAIYSALQPVTSWKLQDAFLLDLDQAIRFKGAIMMSSMIAMILAQLSFLKWQTKAKKNALLGTSDHCYRSASLYICHTALLPIDYYDFYRSRFWFVFAFKPCSYDYFCQAVTARKNSWR
jgi:MFS family permease